MENKEQKKEFKWPDDVRLKMIEHSKMYDDPRVYEYGYFDGWQEAQKSIPAGYEALTKEITSDDEIEKYAKIWGDQWMYSRVAFEGYREGAKWMRRLLEGKLVKKEEGDAVEFAEWVNLQDIFMTNAGYWIKNNPEFRQKHFAESTQELYNEFKNRKG